MSDALIEWRKRHDVMLCALNKDGKVVAAGWHNLDHEPTKYDKKETREFYRECAGYEIKILRGDEVDQFKAMEWIA